MNRELHEVLDGERRESELTLAERLKLREYRKAMSDVLDVLPDGPVPDVTAGVMARIRREERSGERGASGRFWTWLWEPRAVQLAVRPAYAVAAAAALVVLSFVVGPGGGVPASGGVAATDVPPARLEGRVLVHFRFDAPEARSVRLAGDFTGWEPAHAMHEQAPGVWSVVVPLEPGVHDYAFVVDGVEWRPDPLAQQVADGFGGTNSRLALLTPGVL